MELEYKEKKVALSEKTNKQLDKLSEKRQADESFCYRKKDIVSQLIADEFKKEFKQ